MYEEIAKFLEALDFKNGYSKIIDILKKHNKSEYFFIISNLTKISIYEKDFTFKRVIDELKSIISPSYKFNVKSYIESIECCIANNDTEKIQCYLDILNKAKGLDLDLETKYELYDYLDDLEKRLESKKESNETDDLEEALKQKRKELVDSISEKNQKGGIIILGEMPANKRFLVYQLSREYSDIHAFSIGPENEQDIKTVVLRYKSPIYRKIDFPKEIKAADSAYKKGNYEECIDRYLCLLSYGCPNQYIYASIGLSYLKLKDYANALLYLFVSYNLKTKSIKNKYVSRKYERLINLLMSMDKTVDYGTEADELFNLKSQKKLNRTIIEEACTEAGIEYSKFISGLDYAKIEINRGLLSNIAIHHPEIFKELVLISLDSLRCKEKKVPYIMENVQITVVNKDEVKISLLSLVKKIKKKFEYSDFKPVINFEEIEFSTKKEIDDFGFDKFDLLDMYVREYDLTITEAARKLGLTSEELSIVRLIYAKECYTQSYYEKGDEFVKCVEQTKDKTPLVKGILADVKANKLFYKNRASKQKQRVLTLKINPKK